MFGSMLPVQQLPSCDKMPWCKTCWRTGLQQVPAQLTIRGNKTHVDSKPDDPW